MDLNWLDVVVGLMLLGSGVAGIKRGLVRELASLAGVILGVLVGIRFHQSTAEALGPSWAESTAGRVVVFFFLAVVIYAAAEIGGRLVAGGLDAIRMRWLDRLAGAGFGLLRAFLVAGALLLLADLYLPAMENTVKSSALGRPALFTTRAVGLVIWEELRERELFDVGRWI